MTIIDLETERRTKDADRNLIYTDDEGTRWFKFCVDYEHEGKRYGFNISATSGAHAEQLLAAIKDNAKIIGQLCAELENV